MELSFNDQHRGKPDFRLHCLHCRTLPKTPEGLPSSLQLSLSSPKSPHRGGVFQYTFEPRIFSTKPSDVFEFTRPLLSQGGARSAKSDARL